MSGTAALPRLLRMPRALQQLRFGMRQAPFLLSAQRSLGPTFRMSGVLRDDWVTVTSHPDHVRSLFTAPDLTPSLTTVRVDYRELGRHAGRLLDDAAASEVTEILPVELVIRDSTAPASR